MQTACKLDPSWINRKEIETLSSAQGLPGCIVNLSVPFGASEWSQAQDGVHDLTTPLPLLLAHSTYQGPCLVWSHTYWGRTSRQLPRLFLFLSSVTKGSFLLLLTPREGHSTPSLGSAF